MSTIKSSPQSAGFSVFARHYRKALRAHGEAVARDCVPGVGHRTIWEAPDQTADLVIDFLATTPAVRLP